MTAAAAKADFATLEHQLHAALATIQSLRDQIEVLEQALIGRDPMPLVLQLTQTENLVLAFLAQRDQATKGQIMTALYGLRPAEHEIPEQKIVDVFVCKLRKKVVPFGITIETVWGIGYALPPQSKQRLRDLITDEIGGA